MIYNKFVPDLEKETFKTFNMKTLQQQNQDMSIVFKANNQDKLRQFPKLQPNNNISSIIFLSYILLG